MEKRTLIAVVLSILIILLYPVFLAKFYPEHAKARYLKQNDKVYDKVLDTNDRVQFAGRETLDSETGPNVQSFVDTSTYEKNDKVHDRVIDTDLYQVVLSAKGACIKELYLKEYTQADGEALRLVNVEDSQEGLLSITGLDPMARFDTVIYEPIENEQGITFRYAKPRSFEVIKRFKFFNDKYIIELGIEIRNLSPEAQNVQYSIITGSGIDCRTPMDARFMETKALVNSEIVRDNLRKVRQGQAEHRGSVSWTCLRNRYFSLILKPLANTKGSFSRAVGQKNLITGIDMAGLVAQPNATVAQGFLLYAGPNKLDLLASLNMGFEQAIGFGIFGGISRALLFMLKFFYGLVHNYGVSIILLTMVMSLVLFPLTWRSLRSTREMQAIQPLIAKLREEYKDNPQKLNKEMIALYKEHKVNPLGGCLPMLLQMPIFISLYQALMRSVELWGAGFLWIKDLTRPDAARLPFSLPLLGDSINILPILMAISMFMQQKISQPKTSAQTDQQRKMMLFMPLIFGFIFYSLPSGLVLYWLTNTFLMTFHQWLITRKNT